MRNTIAAAFLATTAIPAGAGILDTHYTTEQCARAAVEGILDNPQMVIVEGAVVGAVIDGSGPGPAASVYFDSITGEVFFIGVIASGEPSASLNFNYANDEKGITGQIGTDSFESAKKNILALEKAISECETVAPVAWQVSYSDFKLG